jgi:DNA-binding response OmpR family regulator
LPKCVVKAWAVIEVVTIANKVLRRINNVDDKDLIGCGDLAIDLGKCEAFRWGKPLELTFGEHEMPRFLASSKLRVFNLDALLGKVWGYDQNGGTRTVDVNVDVRRLRSKIEDKGHSFIETVRNIGYRFKEGDVN